MSQETSNTNPGSSSDGVRGRPYYNFSFSGNGRVTFKSPLSRRRHDNHDSIGNWRVDVKTSLSQWRCSITPSRSNRERAPRNFSLEDCQCDICDPNANQGAAPAHLPSNKVPGCLCGDCIPSTDQRVAPVHTLLDDCPCSKCSPINRRVAPVDTSSNEEPERFSSNRISGCQCDNCIEIGPVNTTRISKRRSLPRNNETSRDTSPRARRFFSRPLGLLDRIILPPATPHHAARRFFRKSKAVATKAILTPRSYSLKLNLVGPRFSLVGVRFKNDAWRCFAVMLLVAILLHVVLENRG